MGGEGGGEGRGGEGGRGRGSEEEKGEMGNSHCTVELQTMGTMHHK